MVGYFYTKKREYTLGWPALPEVEALTDRELAQCTVIVDDQADHFLRSDNISG